MLRKFLSTSCAVLFIFIASVAQEASVGTATTTPVTGESETEPKEEPKPTLAITGSADVFFKYDFSKQVSNSFTSFTKTQNAFSLGMASVKFEHTGSKIGMVADLGFGTRAAEFSYNDQGILSAVKQLYVSYSPVENLKFTAGTWGTHVGYELLDPQLNRNYSMSYMFSSGPFSHTGLKAEYSSGKHGFMLGISNPTDMRLVPEAQIKTKFALAQYSYAASEKVKFYLNYVGGKGPDTALINQFDLVANFTLSDQFSIGVNGTLNGAKAWDGTTKKNLSTESWWGAAGYFNYDPTASFGLTLRSEYFNDDKSRLGYGTSIFANTISANFKVGAFKIIPELRFESAGAAIYTNSKSGASSSSTSFLLAAVYSF